MVVTPFYNKITALSFPTKLCELNNFYPCFYNAIRQQLNSFERIPQKGPVNYNFSPL